MRSGVNFGKRPRRRVVAQHGVVGEADPGVERDDVGGDTECLAGTTEDPGAPRRDGGKE